jgi:hypothetical protein
VNRGPVLVETEQPRDELFAISDLFDIGPMRKGPNSGHSSMGHQSEPDRICLLQSPRGLRQAIRFFTDVRIPREKNVPRDFIAEVFASRGERMQIQAFVFGNIEFSAFFIKIGLESQGRVRPQHRAVALDRFEFERTQVSALHLGNFLQKKRIFWSRVR